MNTQKFNIPIMRKLQGFSTFAILSFFTFLTLNSCTGSQAVPEPVSLNITKTYYYFDGPVKIRCRLYPAESFYLTTGDFKAPVIPEGRAIYNSPNFRIIQKLSSDINGNNVSYASYEFPVFLDDGGERLLFKGGVLVVFRPEVKEDEIDSFFAENNISSYNKHETYFNTYIVPTYPGISALNVANQLYQPEITSISTPDKIMFNTAKNK